MRAINERWGNLKREKQKQVARKRKAIPAESMKIQVSTGESCVMLFEKTHFPCSS